MNAARKPRRAPPPLTEQSLREMALAYVGRFATTRAKLRTYLFRKVRERGWAGQEEPPIAALADRFAEQGYIDDSGFALAKARTLSARGYGKRRLIETLRNAGIENDDRGAAIDYSDREALSAALHFAERRRLGPFANKPAAGPKEREKAMGAMIRAGHGFAITRAILSIEPGTLIDLDELAEKAGLSES